jgi:hypothetical protein
MIDREDEHLRMLLKDTLDTEPFAELDHDLWPRMRERLASHRPAPSRWDWALAAAIVGITVAFPSLMLGMLYHL